MTLRRLVPPLLLGTALAASATAGAVLGARAQDGEVAPQRDRHASITEGLDCSACHTTAGWAMGTGTGGRGFDHARTGFPLTGVHRMASCTDCHQAGLETRRDCASCHEDEHQGRLGRGCDRCHSSRAWADTRPLEMHRATRLPLTGMHALADCTQCHLRPGERAWSAPPAECVSCHAEDAARTDTHPDHLGRMGAAPFPRDCAQCHRPSGWSPAIVPDPTMLPLVESLVAPADHEVRFPIRRGAHRGLSCDSCHASPDVPRAVECVGCHAHDRIRLARIHGGTAIPTDGAGCLACHPGGMRR
jgi:hypothetical protein